MTEKPQQLDSMIVNFRTDLEMDNTEIPFILGGMVPYWVDQDPQRIITNNIIENTPNRISNTAYANPRIPFLIEKENNDDIPVHYDAAGLRELGRRYFTEYELLVN